MKLVSALILLSMLAFVTPARWHNGPKTTDPKRPFFGGHDWVVWKAYLLAKNDLDLDYINERPANLMAMFYGTEVPDNGLLPSFSALGNYPDKSKCHCVIFDDDEEVINDRAAVAVAEAFTNAKNAFDRNDRKMAAFYVGVMSHYVADLGQFYHMMSAQDDARWGDEADDGGHSSYEGVIDSAKQMDFVARKVGYLEPYIRKKSVSGTTPRTLTINLAKFVDTGGGTTRNVGWMHSQYVSYTAVRGRRTNPTKWTKAFRDQSGANINQAVNVIAKLMKMVQE